MPHSRNFVVFPCEYKFALKNHDKNREHLGGRCGFTADGPANLSRREGDGGALKFSKPKHGVGGIAASFALTLR